MSSRGTWRAWMRMRVIAEMLGLLLLTVAFCEGTPIGGVSGEYSSGVRCYDCNYSPTGYIQSPSGGWDQGYKEIGYQKCALMNPGDSDLVDKWVCSSGACFIRQDSNGLVYRGCADTENLPYDVRQALNCKYQGPKKSLWWFCEGDLCNEGQLGESESRCGSPPPPPGYELSSQGVGPEVPLLTASPQYDDTPLSNDDSYPLPESEHYSEPYESPSYLPDVDDTYEPPVSPPYLPQIENSYIPPAETTDYAYDTVETPTGKKSYPPPLPNHPAVPYAPFFYFTFPFYHRFLHPSKLWYGYPPHISRHYQVEYQPPRKSIHVPTKSIHSGGYDGQPQDQGVGFIGDAAVYGRGAPPSEHTSIYTDAVPDQGPSYNPPIYEEDTPSIYEPPQDPPHYEDPYNPPAPPVSEPVPVEEEPYDEPIYDPLPPPENKGEVTEEAGLEGYYENVEYFDEPGYVEPQEETVVGTDPCTGSCEDNPSGLYADPDRPDHFIQCGLGEYQGVACTCCRPLYMQCPPDTVFDEGTKVCVHPGKADEYDYSYNEG